MIKIELLDFKLSDAMPILNQRQIGGIDNINDLDVQNNLDYFDSANSYPNKFIEIYWDKDGIKKIINKSTSDNILTGKGAIFDLFLKLVVQHNVI